MLLTACVLISWGEGVAPHESAPEPPVSHINLCDTSRWVQLQPVINFNVVSLESSLVACIKDGIRSWTSCMQVLELPCILYRHYR